MRDPASSHGESSDQMTSNHHPTYDLIAIGLGPAGEKGAAQAAYFGKRVAAVEAHNVGGAVVNTGTLPSKTLRETALYLSGMRQRDLYGIEYSFGREIGAADLFYREKLIERSHLDLVEANIARHKIDMFRGRAEFDDAHTVVVHGADGAAQRLRGEYVLIATGSRPARPESVPFDGVYVHDTDSILRLDRVPASLAIVGAGVIGSEYATLFAALGTRVTLVDGGTRLLPFLDAEICGILLDQMCSMGVNVIFGRHTKSIARRDDAGVSITLDDGDVFDADAVLYCGGRRGNTDGLALDRIGVVPDARGLIGVDEAFRTSAPNVLAAGDVLGFPALASTSMEQARVAVCRAFGFDYKQQMSSLIPYGLYTIPEVSMVGVSEEALQAQGVRYIAGRARYRDNARAQIVGDAAGVLKLLFDPETLRVLGVHIIGERASELVHVGQMCMQFGGTINVFIENVFNFPTIAEAYKYAAYDGLQALARDRAGD
jgi:NAD(P) transhydrogenase